MRLAGCKNFCLAGAHSNIASPDSILAFFQVADMVKQRHRNVPCSKLALSSLIYQAPGKVQREMRDRSCIRGHTDGGSSWSTGRALPSISDSV